LLKNSEHSWVYVGNKLSGFAQRGFKTKTCNCHTKKTVTKKEISCKALSILIRFKVKPQNEVVLFLVWIYMHTLFPSRDGKNFKQACRKWKKTQEQKISNKQRKTPKPLTPQISWQRHADWQNYIGLYQFHQENSTWWSAPPFFIDRLGISQIQVWFI